MQESYQLSNLKEVAQKILDESQHKIIIFDAPMGAGKTTLIKELVKRLGVNDIANSPTFSIVNEYHTDANEIVYHFDLYRIEDEEEALDFGIEEYLFSGNWCFIEWPEKISNLLPDTYHSVEISIDDENTRTLIFV
ncbi:MAG TPA: tRNA (adenosine(37)-N6)-threonylcarbamoyltransferase complex ATPase subunit type 1 TsaE [Flavobacterium sp.]|nr:tRNA (adenosine(37)-N6)-threonylcarbamoyltransferase complex ATPase subunit type 1 TsaE [Flavobacterium sp.]